MSLSVYETFLFACGRGEARLVSFLGEVDADSEPSVRLLVALATVGAEKDLLCELRLKGKEADLFSDSVGFTALSLCSLTSSLPLPIKSTL